MDRVRNCAFAYAAGAVGGLANSLAVWLFGAIGVTTALGVAISPALAPPWLYPRLVWGGIWGVLLLLPVLQRRFVLRGLLFSLGPSIVQLVIVLPVKAGKGMFGLELGTLTPLFVLLFNALWGVVAAWLYARMSRAAH